MELCDICKQRHKDGDCPVTTTVTGLRIDNSLGPEKVYMRVPAPAEKDEMAYLNEPATGKKFAIPFPVCKVGRSPSNHVVISGDVTVSSVHFIISFEGGRFYITDVGTTNGTYLNGEKLTQKVVLSQDDRIRAGRFCLSFSLAKRVKEGRFRAGGIMQQANSLPESLSDHAVPVSQTVEMNKTKSQERALKAALAGTEFGQPESHFPVLISPGEASSLTRNLPEAGDKRTSAIGLSELERELNVLRKQSEAVQERIKEYEQRLSSVGPLGSRPDESDKASAGQTGGKQGAEVRHGSQPYHFTLEELIATCVVALEKFGWQVERSRTSKQDLTLSLSSKVEALVRVVTGDHQNAFMELGKLLTAELDAGSGDARLVKRLLVLQLTAEEQQAVPTDLAQFAAKTKVCLLSTGCLFELQALAASGSFSSEQIRAVLMAADGIPQVCG